MKKTCLVYGNCQADAIKIYFNRIPEFIAAYEIIDLKPIHNLTKNDIPKISIVSKNLDLFIYQPISDNYKGLPELSTKHILSNLPKSCQTISFPVSYFKGYSPETFNLKSLQGKTITSPYSYFNLNFLHDQYFDKPIKESYSNILNDAFYSKEFVLDNLKKTLDNLKNRESNLDIKLTKFILENYRKEKLFHTFNHPNSTLLHYVCKSILKLIVDVREESFDELPKKLRELEMLGRNRFPTYASVASHLNFEFEVNKNVTIAKKEIPLMDFVKEQRNFLKQNKDLILHNLKLNKII